MAVPSKDEILRLLHALREPMGAFFIHLALLDDEPLSENGRERLDAMFGNVERMAAALGEITARFGLEVGEATPLAIVNSDRRSQRVGH